MDDFTTVQFLEFFTNHSGAAEVFTSMSHTIFLGCTVQTT